MKFGDNVILATEEKSNFWWKRVIKNFCFFVERVVFAIRLESRSRRTDKEQRTNGLAAAHVGPRVEARIADQPDAIKYIGDNPVKTHIRDILQNIARNEHYFLRLTLFFFFCYKKCGPRFNDWCLKLFWIVSEKYKIAETEYYYTIYVKCKIMFHERHPFIKFSIV